MCATNLDSRVARRRRAAAAATLIYHRPVPAARRALTILALAGLLPGGCGLAPIARSPEPPRFDFAYRATSGSGIMNQILEITNPSPRSYAPVLKLSAVDDSGITLPEVTVSTLFGSDRGELVVPARTGVVDVMRFSGKHLDRVADVRASVSTAALVHYPAITSEPTVTPIDSSDAVVTRNDVFARVRVNNDNNDPITIRLVYIIWDTPPEGQTQQADRTEPIGDLVTVPAHGETTVQITPNDAALIRKYAGAAPASIKAYFSY